MEGIEERNHAEVEEMARRAKIAGAVWFRESTIRRNPDATPSLEWFGTEDDDESSDNLDDRSDDEDRA